MLLIASIIDVLSVMMVLILPIVLVWRYTICGVFMATLIIEINIILTDALISKLRGQQLDNENVEFWITIWIPVFFYCIFILLIKFLLKICKKVFES
ncbi:hypothetical protein [Kamptonema sp. UHCC 0994]|uniref:hypothetical protein n=1 Tax=Kamptonema sp. UHCC 0994 TaxID=3031329 RepID=UPI0023B92826|nr:hypothetical protein [Kamptonema sp. UHCC 0994]MDF0555432.1 hypothetical protein [Kamptonema sp. UHCC 0994]